MARHEVSASEPSSNAPTATDAAEPEALVITHAFDSGESGEPYSATVRLIGRHLGARGAAKRRDSFEHEEVVNGIVPGIGKVTVTSRVFGLEPGPWTVTADVIRPGVHGGHRRPLQRAGRFSVEPIEPAGWSWRHRNLVPAAMTIGTRWAMLAPLANQPGVIQGIWPALAALAIVGGLAVLALALAHESVPVAQSLVVSVVAVASGIIGAKLWYAALHPHESWRSKSQGWAVDGLLVVALTVAVVGLAGFGLPIGDYLDAAAPALFVGVAIGRIGCFFAGCCAGRLTRSRWGIWSSDRRVGGRRIPTQLLESAAGLFLGAVTMLAMHSRLAIPSGLTFFVAFGAYLVARQFLLRLRAERRDYSWRRTSAAVG